MVWERRRAMLILGAAVCGFLLDLLLGDPEWMPHPVVLMGKIISRAEGTLRRRFPPTPGGEIAAGTILAALLPLGTLAFCGGVCFLALCIHPALCFAVQTLWCWQALAMRGCCRRARRSKGSWNGRIFLRPGPRWGASWAGTRTA